MQGMFKNDSNLTSVDFTQNTLSEVTDISHMFENDTKLETMTTATLSTDSGKSFKKLTDTSYAFANDVLLTNLDSLKAWQGWYLTDLSGMFKNDAKITSLNLSNLGWNTFGGHPNTGDSSVGEGMFDGTNLQSITLSPSLSFSTNTALTSTSGGQWVSAVGKNSGKTFNFLGVPMIDSSGTATGGIGSLYTGTAVSNDIQLIYSATQIPNGTAVSNLITINTNHGEISFVAQGIVGQTSSVNIPDTFKFEDGNTYTRSSDSPATVDVTFDQTQATAPGIATYVGAANAETTVNVTNPDGSTSKLTIPAGNYGDKDVTVSPDAITGYVTPSVNVSYGADGTPTITQDGTTIDSTNSVTYTGVTNAETSVNVTNPDGSTSKLTIPAGKYGDNNVTVSPDPVTGYDTPIVTVSYGTDGTPIVTENGTTINDTTPVTYTGVANAETSVNVNNPDGSTSKLTIPAGNYGDKDVTVSPDPVTGYVTPIVTVSYGTDGTPIVTENGTTINDTTPVTYTGVTNAETSVNVNNPDGSTSKLTIPAGKYGDKDVTVSPDPVTGYVTPIVTVSYGTDGTPIVTENGTTINDTTPVTYTGVANAETSVNVNNPDGSTSKLTIPAGNYGDKNVTVSPDPITGYDTPIVTVSYGTDGTPIVTENGTTINDTTPVTYTGVTNAETSVNVTNPDGSTSKLTIPAGNYGDKDVTVTVPAKEGYLPTTVNVSYGTDGTPTVTQNGTTINDTTPVTYTGVANAETSVNVNNPDGSTSKLTIPAGKYGDKNVTVSPDAITGYVTPIVTVSYGTDGTPTITQNGTTINDTTPVTYTGVTNAETSVNVTNPDGSTSKLTIPAGKYGDKNVTVSPDPVAGYDTPIVTVSYGTDGTPIVTENGTTINDTTPVTYTGVANAETSVNVTNPDGSTSKLTIPAGNYGDKDVTISPDPVTGYDTPIVTVSYGTDGTPTVTQNGTTINDTTPVTYTGVTNAETSVNVTNPDGSTSKLTIPAGKYGDKDVTVTVPAKEGYLPTTVNVSYGTDGTPTITQDGTTIDSTNSVTYTGVANAESSVNVTNPDGSTSKLTIPAGKYGDKNVTVSPDPITGYDTPIVTVSYGTDGTPIVTENGTTINDTTPVTYTGVTNAESSVNVTNPDGSTSKLTIPAGKYGDKDVTVTVPAKEGYLPTTVNVSYGTDGTPTVTQNGTTINDTTPVTYTGVTNPESSVNVTNPDGSTSKLTIPAGKYGDKDVTVTVPAKEGYLPTTVNVSYGTDGTPTVTQDGTTINDTTPVTYTGVTNAETSVNVTNPDGSTSKLTIPAGKYGDNNVTVSPDPVTGYDTPIVTVSYGTDGTPIVTENGTTINDTTPVTYTGVANAESSVNVTNPDGSTSKLTIPAGKYGDKDVTVTAPAKEGYLPTTVNVSYGTDGTPTVTQNGTTINDTTPVTYTGVTNPESSVNVTNPDGSTSKLAIPAGKYGDKDVTVTVPAKEGYLPTTVNVSYGTDGTPTVTQDGTTISDTNPVTYTGVTNPAQTLTVNNPDGTTSELTVPEGKFGDAPVTVTAPTVSGYSAPSVIVTYNSDGTSTITDANDVTKTITSADDLSYTRKSSGGSSTVNSGEGVIEQKVQTISTYSDQPDVELYQLSSDNKMSQITNRSLATASNWYSDATVTIDGVSYYRVATNEWAKMSQAYPYQALNLHIRTYNDSEKALYKAEDIVISNETLAPSSSWMTDRETYVINNTKYYRVATNEFVNADDVYIYSPVSMVVTTHSNQYTTLYDAKGVAVTNRSLNSNSSWKTDSITYINGDKYYRVATNEFVKASDVDVNH